MPPVTLAVAQETAIDRTASTQAQPTPHSAQTGGETINLVAAVLKVVASLALVVGIMFLLTVLFKKMGMTGGKIKQGSLIQIMETRMIAPKKYIAVLQIAREYVVVGITDQNISLLSTLENDPELTDYLGSTLAQPESSLGSTFSALLQKAAKKITSSEKPGNSAS